jgi:toxin-antitoxin system PIN domain toxin
MILPDVNVLIYAFREGADDHQAYARWLTGVSGVEELLFPDVVLTGFLRIVTNRRIVSPVVPVRQALSFADAIRTAPRARTVASSGAVWAQLSVLLERDPGVRGNLVPDAYLAATAITHKARLATRDRGFARFPGLRWFDPAAA